MSVKDQMAADVGIFFNLDEFGEQAQYNGVDIVVVPEIGESNRKGNSITADGQSNQAWFWVSEIDVPEPASGDEITHKSITWQVIRISEFGGGMHRIECVANESAFGSRW